MSFGYSTFTGRSRAGKGKLHYGISEKRLKALASIAGDRHAKLNSHAESMRQFTQIYIQHARDLARSGKKDDARNWLRFFENSKILYVLESFPKVKGLQELQSSLQTLRSECHPLDQASWQTDIEAIRYCLNEILARMPAGSSGVRRPVSRRNGIASIGRKDFERVKAVVLPLIARRSPARFNGSPDGVLISTTENESGSSA